MSLISKLTQLARKKDLQIDEHDATKLVLLAFTFFFIIGSYSILRSLKTSIFLALVGKEYQPLTRFVAMGLLLPCMLFYGKLVDTLKRYQLVLFFFGSYVVLTIISAYLLMHPVYGLSNTTTSPFRFLGWFFEIFMDLFQVLVVGTFWGFVNSISTPRFASKNYWMIVTASRVGGMLSTALSLILLKNCTLSQHHSIPMLVIISTGLLIGALLCIYKLTKKIPHDHLHGYEAAYKEEKKSIATKEKPGMLEGLKLMLTQPYVLGIFALVYSYEIIGAIFDYRMQVLLSVETGNQVGLMSLWMLAYTFTFQLMSFILAFFGTSTLPSKIGIQKCLVLVPMVIIGLIALSFVSPTFLTIFLIMVAMRAINYGFNQPIREILYIPTIKDIQFKSKAWIDSFGRNFSKSSGAVINITTAIAQSSQIALMMQSGLCIAVSGVWIFVAYLIGKKYNHTIKHNEVIGKPD